jgi:hypothetical protein
MRTLRGIKGFIIERKRQKLSRVPGVQTNSVCTFCNDILQETVVPAAEFDWINSGLVNPLDCK